MLPKPVQANDTCPTDVCMYIEYYEFYINVYMKLFQKDGFYAKCFPKSELNFNGLMRTSENENAINVIKRKAI
jgi:hypothetical protein